MALIKAIELSRSALNWSVAQVEKLKVESMLGGAVWCRFACVDTGKEYGDVFVPADSWEQGGPLIEKYGITITHQATRWAAEDDDGVYAYGETPLVAAMRCIVRAKLGEEVGIPDPPVRYRCPACGSSKLNVAVHVFAELTQSPDGNYETEPVGSHEWDDDSAAACRSCAWVGDMQQADTQPLED